MGHKFERYCKEYENIENYDKALKDNFKGWSCHHRLETHNSDGERRLVDISMDELIALGMYYHRPAEELIFLPVGEHHSLHDEGENHPMYGKHHSAESIQKISEANKGENHPMYGKHHSEESKKRIGTAHKGNKYRLGKHHSEESKKRIGEGNRGKHHSAESIQKISEAMKGNKYALGNTATKGTHWYNNGKTNVMAKECPDGFTPGRLLK